MTSFFYLLRGIYLITNLVGVFSIPDRKYLGNLLLQKNYLIRTKLDFGFQIDYEWYYSTPVTLFIYLY